MKSEEIKRARAALGLTQEDLARELGIHRRTIIRWEKGDGINNVVYIRAIRGLVKGNEKAKKAKR